VSTGPYEFGRRDGFDPQCCATCRFAVLHGGHGSHAVRRYCNLRRAWLPFKQRERLRMFGCDGFERDAASAEAIALSCAPHARRRWLERARFREAQMMERPPDKLSFRQWLIHIALVTLDAPECGQLLIQRAVRERVPLHIALRHQASAMADSVERSLLLHANGTPDARSAAALRLWQAYDAYANS
jgi:hypothetical protein